MQASDWAVSKEEVACIAEKARQLIAAYERRSQGAMKATLNEEAALASLEIVMGSIQNVRKVRP